MKAELQSLLDMANAGHKFVVVGIEETSNWHEDIQRIAGRMDGVYLVDLTQPTHCCEIAVSFPATFLYNHAYNTQEVEDETLGEWEHDNGGESLMYLQGHNRYYPVTFYDEAEDIEEAEDKERGNPHYFGFLLQNHGHEDTKHFIR